MTIPENKKERYQQLLGWLDVGLVTLIASFWAVWGGIENFHEGWYHASFIDNVLMMIMQYWLFALVFISIGLTGLQYPKLTLVLCIILGIVAGFFFSGAAFSVLWLMIVIPFTIIGLLFFFGRPSPRWLAVAIMVGLPVLILIVTTAFGVIRVSKRLDDGNYGTRIVEGNNGINLTWAPRGPGWPEGGQSYEEAIDICARLSEDGTALHDEQVNIWRLPTVEEAVACQMLHGENANGVWNEDTQMADYDRTPDKETPLWDPHSQVIYYWTDTKVDDQAAYIIVYNGDVYPRFVDSQYGYLSFRAVKD